MNTFLCTMLLLFFFFNDTATTEIYPLSLHDALPISGRGQTHRHENPRCDAGMGRDRKSTRLNSSHDQISYAVFCLKKKKNFRTIGLSRKKKEKKIGKKRNQKRE